MLKKKIKICFVVTIFRTYEAFLLDFSRYLHETGGYDISLICSDSPRIQSILPEYVHFHPISMSRGVSFDAFSSIKSIAKIFTEKKYDIIQYSTPNAAFYAALAGRCTAVPIRLYCQWGIRYMGFNGLKRFLFKALEKATCFNSTFIQAESHGIMHFGIEEVLYTKDKCMVVGNGSACGVDLKRFKIEKKDEWRKEIREKFGIPNDSIVFQYAARLTADKGLNELLEAFLRSDYLCSSYLIISGTMDNRKTLNDKLLNTAKECERVIFTENVEDIEKYYAACDVFVSPSYREGFGLVVVEAESMGIPVIVTDVPGQIDAIVPEKTGLTCKAKDVHTLEEQMVRLHDSSELRFMLGKGAETFSRTCFDRSSLFKKMEINLRELSGIFDAKN